MMKDVNLRKAYQETRHIWDVNAAYWDEYMGESNDFVNLVCWPAIERLLIVSPARTCPFRMQLQVRFLHGSSLFIGSLVISRDIFGSYLGRFI